MCSIGLNKGKLKNQQRMENSYFAFYLWQFFCFVMDFGKWSLAKERNHKYYYFCYRWFPVEWTERMFISGHQSSRKKVPEARKILIGCDKFERVATPSLTPTWVTPMNYRMIWPFERLDSNLHANINLPHTALFPKFPNEFCFFCWRREFDAVCYSNGRVAD